MVNRTLEQMIDAVQDGDDEFLLPQEVAGLFRVDVRTVVRWANDGKLTAVRTVGGHRRYFRSEVDGLLELS